MATTAPELITTTGEVLPEAGLETVDYVIIIVYFVLILMVGIWAMCRSNRSDVKGFFLAGRDITWFPVGASLFSSNIGSGHFVGLAGSGAASGLVQGSFEWNAMVTLWFLGWIFAPIYIASGVVTMPEYLKQRFGGSRIQLFLSFLSLFLYIFTKISADLFAGAIFIQEALGWNLYVAIIALLAVTALYTVTGGLAAVIYTDTAQTVVMLIGALIMMFTSFNYIGGYEEIWNQYMYAIPDVRPMNTTCGIPREDSYHVFRDPITADMPWPGMVFGITINSIWYWCADQVIVQRTLAAKNLSHAKGGCVMAGLIKILPMFMMVMVGMVSRIVFPNTIGCVDPEECEAACGNQYGCSNSAYAKLVLLIMPLGLKGLLLAVMIAALMSSLTSVFNSGSTLFTMDVWTRFRPKAGNKELMIVGRMFILAMVGVSIAWIPVVQSFSSGKLFDYIQAISSYLSPQISVVFTLAVFWPRLNEPGAFWGMTLGMACGVAAMILKFILVDPLCGEPEYRPTLFTIHYLYVGMMLAGITLVLSVMITYVTPPPDSETILRLTWWTRYTKRDRKPIFDPYTEKVKEKEKLELDELKAAEKSEGADNSGFVSDGGKPVGNTFEEVGVETEEKSCLQKGLALFCGLEDDKPTVELSEEDKAELKKMMDISEEPRPALLVNIGAIAMGCALCFLFGYYA